MDELKGILRENLSAFVWYAFEKMHPTTDFLSNWHVDLIAEHLEAVSHRDIKRLIINIPPRYLKSFISTVAFPAWVQGRNPSETFMTASFSKKLATSHCLGSRTIMETGWYQSLFPQTSLSKDHNLKDHYKTAEHGERFSTSVGATTTGMGGNILILDDPISPDQARSAVKRKEANIWYQGSFRNRLNDKRNGAIIVIMQRVAEDDTAGFLLETGNWTHLNIPLIETERKDYSFGRVKKIREVGEVLHEDREGLEQIEELRKEVGFDSFETQFQQDPLPTDSSLVKSDWLLEYDPQFVEYDSVYVSWDTAIKIGSDNAKSIGIVFGTKRDSVYVLDVLGGQFEYPELKRYCINVLNNCQEKYGKNPAAVLVEDRSSGEALIQDLKKLGLGNVIPIQPNQDKLTRMATQTPIMEAGNFKLPKEAKWKDSYVKELMQFPRGKLKDKVDATSQFLGWFSQRKRNLGLIKPKILHFNNSHSSKYTVV